MNFLHNMTVEKLVRIEQLAVKDKISAIQDGVQIICVMENGTGAYRKLIGKTNLPEEMKLTIKVAGVEKGVTVQQGRAISALFERQIISLGEQDISIKALDKLLQPSNVQITADILIREKDNGILD